MRDKFDHILQFKISLRDISPPIWRRIQVPCTYSFWDLHVAIQDAMGWLDYHLHLFQMRDPATGMKMEIGIPFDDEMWEEEILPGWELPIAQFFTLLNRKADYTYDFGDDWQHRIVLEQIKPRASDVAYPVCVGGRRACPPEDCGGSWGYAAFLQAIADPGHEEHEEMLEWVGGDFDPALFDKDTVSFDDPRERWLYAFKGR